MIPPKRGEGKRDPFATAGRPLHGRLEPPGGIRKNGQRIGQVEIRAEDGRSSIRRRPGLGRNAARTASAEARLGNNAAQQSPAAKRPKPATPESGPGGLDLAASSRDPMVAAGADQ